MITYNPEAIEDAGFRPVGEPSADMPGIGKLRRIAIAENVTIASVTAFRHTDGRWAVYLRPNAVTGFTDAPMLG